MNAPMPLQQPSQDPLAQLQDIHLPEAISNWPPAWGWWVLSVIILTTLALLIFLWRRNKNRNGYRQQAIIELENAHQQYSTEQSSEYLQAVSIILRRTALSGLGTRFNPSLKGEAWLLWLDEQISHSHCVFREGNGRALLAGPYQKSPEYNRTELHNAAIYWIKHHRNQWQKPIKQKNTVKHTQEAAQDV